MMKKLVVIAIVLVAGLAANPLYAEKKANKVVCFKSDMDCENCEAKLTEYLKFEKGVKDLKVDHVTNTVMIEYKEGKNTEEGFVKAIAKKGYKADRITEEEYNKITSKSNTKE